MGGSPKIETPEPTEEERGLQREQTELLRQQREILLQQSKQGNMILPILLKESGFQPIFDAQGNLVDIKEASDEQSALRKEIETGFLRRSQAALKGELPVDAALTRELATNERTLRETLLKELGPGFETSTPGMESLSRFGETKTSILDAARRADLTLAESLGLARTTGNRGLTNQLGPAAIAGIPGNMEGMSNVVQGFNSPLSWFQNQRQMKFQANMQRAQSGSSTMGQIFGGLGMMGGMALGRMKF